jgi:hypothetical protein
MKDLGTTRIRQVFLFFPRCINGEWRWWRCAKFREQVMEQWAQAPECRGFMARVWVPIKWIGK